MKGPIKWTNGGNKSLLSLASLEVIKITWFTALDERSNMNKLSMPLKDPSPRSCCLENTKTNLCWFHGTFKGTVGQMFSAKIFTNMKFFWKRWPSVIYEGAVWRTHFKGVLNKINFFALFSQTLQRSITSWFLSIRFFLES